jgi:hypothetical protein
MNSSLKYPGFVLHEVCLQAALRIEQESVLDQIVGPASFDQ